MSVQTTSRYRSADRCVRHVIGTIAVALALVGSGAGDSDSEGAVRRLNSNSLPLCADV